MSHHCAKHWQNKCVKKRSSRRRSPMRGWAASAPQRGRPRERLMNDCGAGCFLMPQSRGFPICEKRSLGRSCQVSCKGLLAAKTRAREWRSRNPPI